METGGRMKPINQLAPANLPVPPGSREHLILLGLLYVEQHVAWLNRKAQAAADERDRRQLRELECAR